MEVTFKTDGTYVTVGGSLSCYKEYRHNLKQCKQRLGHIQSIQSNFPFVFEMRQQMTITQIGVVDVYLTGDHVEGIKLHRATKKDREDTVVVLVPKNINEALTQTRRIAEDRLMAFSKQTRAETINKTSFIREDTIDTHYAVLAEQTIVPSI